MSWYEDFKTGKKRDERIATEGAYFINTIESCVVKILKDGDYFAKFSGEKEFKLDVNTDLVSGAMMENREITRVEYLNY